MEGGESKFAKFTEPTLKAFSKARCQSVSVNKQELVDRAIVCQKNAFSFSTRSRSSFHPGYDANTFFSFLPSSTTFISDSVILANATVVTFVLLRNSCFSVHCYTQSKPTPPQKSARKWQLRPFANSCRKDYKGYSLVQTSFAELPKTAVHSVGGSVVRCGHLFSR